MVWVREVKKKLPLSMGDPAGHGRHFEIRPPRCCLKGAHLATEIQGKFVSARVARRTEYRGLMFFLWSGLHSLSLVAESVGSFFILFPALSVGVLLWTRRSMESRGSAQRRPACRLDCGSSGDSKRKDKN